MVHVKKKNNKDVLKVNFFGAFRWIIHFMMILIAILFATVLIPEMRQLSIIQCLPIWIVFLSIPILVYVVYFKAVFGNIVYTKEGVGQSLFGKYIHFIKWEEIKQAGIVTGIRMPCIYFSKEVLPRSKLWNMNYSKINDSLIVCTLNQKIIIFISQYVDTDNILYR